MAVKQPDHTNALLACYKHAVYVEIKIMSYYELLRSVASAELMRYQRAALREAERIQQVVKKALGGEDGLERALIEKEE